MGDSAYQLVQIMYWIALSTWFGAVLFIAIAAPVVFKTVTEHRPILPNVLSVNLENQHATLLAGSIVGDLIVRLSRVQLLCAAVLAVALVAQAGTIDLSHGPDILRSNRVAYGLRVVMFLAALGVVVYDWRVAWPKVVALRSKYIDNADDPEVANPAKDDFDREQRRTVSLLMFVVAMLLGVIAFSGNITPKGADASSTSVTLPASPN
jgi:hypothetical protein